MITGGYTRKLLRINLSTREHSIEPIELQEYEQFLGGRGTGAAWYWSEIPPDVAPLESANKLGFFTGPMTGAPLVSTTKFQLATKGPETGRYLCSNSSGNFGPRLREAGFDALVLEGMSEQWTAVVIENNEVRFIDDAAWQGHDSHAISPGAPRPAGGQEVGDDEHWTGCREPGGLCLHFRGRWARLWARRRRRGDGLQEGQKRWRCAATIRFQSPISRNAKRSPTWRATT